MRREINSSWTKRSREFQISAEQKVEPLQHEGTTPEWFFSAKVSVKPLEHNARTVREQLFSSKDFSEACLVSTLLSEPELANRSEMRNGLHFMAVKFEREFIQMPGNWIEIKENNIISENLTPLRNNVNLLRPGDVFSHFSGRSRMREKMSSLPMSSCFQSFDQGGQFWNWILD